MPDKQKFPNKPRLVKHAKVLMKLELKPTEVENRQQAEIAAWLEMSAKTHWVLGKPLGSL